MNKNKFFIISILSTSGLLLSILSCNPSQTSGYNPSSTSDTTRNYQYEHYCDSIYDADLDYYHDVLVETDSFQNYIEEHGQWWE